MLISLIINVSYWRLFFIILLTLYLSLYLTRWYRILVIVLSWLLDITIVVTILLSWPVIILVTLLTVTFSIFCPTHVTKFITTTTCHMATSFILLHPKSTFWTLFIFCTLSKLYKFLILFSHFSVLLILLACHACMRLCFTPQTITFRTF